MKYYKQKKYSYENIRNIKPKNMNKKYAVGVWNSEKQKYEVHHRTDILEYAKAQAAIINANGAIAIILNYVIE